MTQPTAHVVADSVSPTGIRLADTGKTGVTGNLRGWAQPRHLTRKDTAA